ncbi:MAG: sugar-binding protein [Pseudomonadota bacterium]
MLRPMILVALLLALTAVDAEEPRSADSTAINVPQATSSVRIDGLADEAAWDLAEWHAMDQIILGETPSAADFRGRYKLLWNSEGLYLLADIVDDHLVDARPDPLFAYWDDDALEVFLDADGEAGPHRDDYRAFAYHIALDNQAIDIGPDGPLALPSHVTARWQRQTEAPYALRWEVHLRIATSNAEGSHVTGFRSLQADEELRFMLAYCDADDASGRQHFVGDIAITPRDGDRNLGYLDSRVFGRIKLIH